MVMIKKTILFNVVFVIILSSCMDNGLMESPKSSSSYLSYSEIKNNSTSLFRFMRNATDSTNTEGRFKEGEGDIIPFELDSMMSQVPRILMDMKSLPRDNYKEAYALLDDIKEEILASGKLKHDLLMDIKILDDPSSNACCLPGGIIYVNKGLFYDLNSSDELAGVLAHEVMHAENRDYLKDIVPSIIQEQLGSFISATFYSCILMNKPKWIVIPSFLYASNYYLSMKAKQKMESNADIQGTELLRYSKYSADAVCDWFRRGTEEKEGTTKQGLIMKILTGNFMSSHPSHAFRTKNIGKYVRDHKFLNYGTSVDVDENFLSIQKNFKTEDEERGNGLPDDYEEEEESPYEEEMREKVDVLTSELDKLVEKIGEMEGRVILDKEEYENYQIWKAGWAYGNVELQKFSSNKEAPKDEDYEVPVRKKRRTNKKSKK